MDAHENPGWSNLIGPEFEWCTWPDGESYHTEQSLFWWVVEGIIQSFPGTYDDVPWHYTEKAAERLMR